MTTPLDLDDLELDARWRRLFGEPLPILGAQAIVRRILDATEAELGSRERAAGSNIVCLTSRRAVGV